MFDTYDFFLDFYAPCFLKFLKVSPPNALLPSSQISKSASLNPHGNQITFHVFSVIVKNAVGVASLQGIPGDTLLFTGFLRIYLTVAIEREYAIQVALLTPSQSVRSRSRNVYPEQYT